MKTRKILLLLCICILSGYLQAQEQKKLDSLLSVLKSMPIDTAKVTIYGQISRLFAIEIGNFNLANEYLDSVKSLSSLLKYENGMIYGIFLQGVINQESRNFKEALSNYEKASQYYLKNGDSIKAFNAILGTAQIYGIQGDFEKGLELHFFMAEFFERKNALNSLAGSFRSIANIFRKIEKYEDSKNYHKKSLAILKAQGNEASYAMGLQNLANVYVSSGDNGTALDLYKEALQVIRSTGNKNREAFILTNMGYLFGELNHLEKAIEYQSEAVAIWKNLSQDYNTIEPLDNLGSLYFKLKNYDKAESYFKEALPLTKEAGSKTGIAELYRELSEVYLAKGNYKNAYNYNNLFWSLKDSIFNIENAKQINEFQKKYETEKKDQQITLLAQEKELQRKETQRQATIKNAVIGGLLLLTLLAGLLFYTLRQRLKNQKALSAKNKEISEVNFKRQLTELEMKALQAQINPHFIFNCMNSINQMILDGDNKNASKYLTKFGKLIRMVLENAESTEVSLKDELTLLEAYIQLEALRFSGEILHKIDLKGDIDLENTYLPSMVLQPFVENAIWHGLMHRKDTGNGRIVISIEQQGEELVCQIEDNGVGRKKAFELQQRSVYKSKSLGLKITEERLQLLSKELKRQLIHITDLTNQAGEALGTRVTVNIPIS